MVKIQVDDVDEMFTEIELIRQNGWREIKIPVSMRNWIAPDDGGLSIRMMDY